MKKIVLCTALTLLYLVAFAQGGDVVSRFSKKVSEGRITFSYTYTMEGKIPVKGSGKAIVQGDKFLVDGDGSRIICSGSDRWIVDNESKEAICEKVPTGGTDLLSNPAALLARSDDVFHQRKISQDTFKGGNVVSATIRPGGTSAIESLSLYFSGETPVGLSVVMTSGEKTVFDIDGLKFLPAGDEKEFFFDEKGLSDDWMVTDLR